MLAELIGVLLEIQLFIEHPCLAKFSIWFCGMGKPAVHEMVTAKKKKKGTGN